MIQVIDPFKFDCLVKDIEQYFRLDYTSFQKEKMYQKLKFYDEKFLKKAVDYVIEMHPYKRLPLISEIRQAIEQVSIERSDVRIEELEDQYCEHCNNIGGVIREKNGYDVFFPCMRCRKGKQYQKNFEREFQKGVLKKTGILKED